MTRQEIEFLVNQIIPDVTYLHFQCRDKSGYWTVKIEEFSLEGREITRLNDLFQDNNPLITASMTGLVGVTYCTPVIHE